MDSMAVEQTLPLLELPSSSKELKVLERVEFCHSEFTISNVLLLPDIFMHDMQMRS
jgi:hypothetical protein